VDKIYQAVNRFYEGAGSRRWRSGENTDRWQKRKPEEKRLRGGSQARCIRAGAVKRGSCS